VLIGRHKLQGVHPDLCRVIQAAAVLYPGDLLVVEGLRTLAQQVEYVASGASRTMNSRHLPDANGVGYAVDLCFVIGGKDRWDWPLYDRLRPHLLAAAKNEIVPIELGMDWETFKDGPHVQLPHQSYPAATRTDIPPVVTT
jgi:peptidoglycan L-alanyl-D-glutamate endopeptidase CwlK